MSGPRVSRDRFWSGKSANLTPEPGPHFGAFSEKNAYRSDALSFLMGGAFNMHVVAEFVEKKAPGEGYSMPNTVVFCVRYATAPNRDRSAQNDAAELPVA